MLVWNLVGAGIKAVIEYLSAHVLTCLVPAFFIAGAMSALLPKDKIIKYLGRDVPKYRVYPLAVISGLLLAVCSCTILPLFAGIKRKGAGTGPAIAFLYTAPATNILAIVFTGSVLGWEFAIARIILSVTFATVIGITISTIFRKEDIEEERKAPLGVTVKDESTLPHHRLLLFFATLLGILVVGVAKIGMGMKSAGLAVLILFLIVQVRFNFRREETEAWLKETWMFSRTIFPLLLIGIFVAGVLTEALPSSLLAEHLGGNTVSANLMAVLFGVFMYFPTLVEVPMAKMFLGLGMAKGPLLAYLLADPVVSLPSILVVRKFLGNRRTLAYVGLIVIFTCLSGLIYGSFAG